MSENGKNCDNSYMNDKMKEILSNYKKEKDNLIQILNNVQDAFGYIPQEAQKQISEYLNITMADVYGVITFYSRFTLKPKGKYNVSVCLGTACFVKGSEEILEAVKRILNIDVGQTTKDGKFSIDATRCIGACGLAPVFTVNDEVYGKATVKLVEEVLKEYQEQ